MTEAGDRSRDHFSFLDGPRRRSRRGSSNLTRIRHDLGALGPWLRPKRAGPHEKDAWPRLRRDFQGHKARSCAFAPGNPGLVWSKVAYHDAGARGRARWQN